MLMRWRSRLSLEHEKRIHTYECHLTGMRVRGEIAFDTVGYQPQPYYAWHVP